MTAFAGFRDLNDYLSTRCREHNLSFNALSADELGWNHSYIHGIATGLFLPSAARCDIIANYFGDNPRIVRVLAGIELPPTDGDPIIVELKEFAASLTTGQRRELLKFAHYLKSKDDPPGR